MMRQYSDNPTKDLEELEVFCGFVFNSSGVARRRQRDNSQAMKEEFDRVTQLIVSQMRHPSFNAIDTPMVETTPTNGLFPVNGGEATSKESDFMRRSREALELCWRCLEISFINPSAGQAVSDYYHETGKLVSFRIVAASCLLRELNLFCQAQGRSQS
jgi:hypothetical protein